MHLFYRLCVRGQIPFEQGVKNLLFFFAKSTMPALTIKSALDLFIFRDNPLVYRVKQVVVAMQYKTAGSGGV